MAHSTAAANRSSQLCLNPKGAHEATEAALNALGEKVDHHKLVARGGELLLQLLKVAAPRVSAAHRLWRRRRRTHATSVWPMVDCAARRLDY